MKRVSSRIIGAIKGVNFGQFYETCEFLDQLTTKKMVFFGEIQSVPKVVQMQLAI